MNGPSDPRGAGLRAASHRSVVGVELRVTPAGDLVHPAIADHHVSVHAGRPVRVSCPANGAPSIRTRGEVNVFPAGVSDAWTEDDESRTVDVRVPDPLVRRVAEEMGLDPGRVSIAPRYHLRDVRIEHIAWALEAERRAGFANGMLFRESLGLALAVHPGTARRPFHAAASRRTSFVGWSTASMRTSTRTSRSRGSRARRA